MPVRLQPLGIAQIRPPTADLMPITPQAPKEVNGFVRVRACVDSGARLSTLSKRVLPKYKPTPSQMSKEGICFVTATDDPVENEGEITVPTFSPELVRTDQRWQVADIKTPLLSVEEEVDKDQWVILTKVRRVHP